MDSFIEFLNNTLPLDSWVVSKPSYSHIGIIVALFLGTIQINSYRKHRKFIRTHGEADYRPAFNPMTALGMTFGIGLQWHWEQRFTAYSKPKKEIISLEPTLWGEPYLYTNSIEVVRQIAGGGTTTTWIKPHWSAVASEYWGKNILTVNGSEWRKYRKIMQPSFNPKLYEMVWSEVTRLYNQLLVSSNGAWPTESGKTISFTQFLDNTHRLGLCIILSCGFGLSLNWDERAYADKERRSVSLDDGIRVQGDNMILVSFTPSWFLSLPFKKLRYIKEGINAMRAWFRSSVAAKKREIAQILEETDGDLESESLKRDVFSRLALASQGGGKVYLEDSEIIGNTWVMFFAGHDTTAAAIAAVLCLLACHPHEQDIVYDEIRSVAQSNGGKLAFEHFELLVKTRAAFIEGLRMFPSGSLLIREAAEDTVISVPTIKADGSVYQKNTPMPKGTVIVIDMVGIQYNPRYFPSPEVYRPSRWYDTTTDDAYTAFSVGPRSCIGKKFAVTEAIAFLSNLLRDYSVEPLLKDGENLESWKERVLGRTEVKLTFSISEAPLRFRKR